MQASKDRKQGRKDTSMNRDVTREILRALGYGYRLEIMQQLSKGSLTATDLQIRTGISQANLSQQMKDLIHLGLVTSERDGKFTIYHIHKERIREVIRELQNLL